MNRNPSLGILFAGMMQRQRINAAQAMLNSRRIYVFLFNAIINLFRAGKDKKIGGVFQRLPIRTKPKFYNGILFYTSFVYEENTFFG
jgi:hypothetical protein